MKMPQALVIGIDRYSAPRIRPLTCAVNDALEISKRLESAGFEVVTLTNENATQKAIEGELDGGLDDRTADEDDPVLVYWAGHGLTDLRDAEREWSTFLLPFDADVERPMSTALAVQHVWALLNRLRTRRLLVLLDTCFSGAFAGDGFGRGFALGDTRGAPALTDDFLKMEGHGRIVVTACGPNQVAREDPKQGHGHFTRALLSVLDRGAADGVRTASVPALTSSLRDEVHRITRNGQTPSLHQSAVGSDWTIPLPPPAPFQPPVPSWAFIGTSGGVGKTTLAMMTAELLAEAGNTVMYLDVDIEHYGGTSEWCQRAGTDIGHTRTFADHVAVQSRAKNRVAARHLTDHLVDVTPEYLRRHECGRILLLPAARASDKVFSFELVAEIKDRRSNAICRQVLDAAFERGMRQGATCIVIDCGAQFDPLVVNAFAAAHHPFVVAAARAGAREKREAMLTNSTHTVPEFNRMRVETVVNRAPSREALVQHWGNPDFSSPGTAFHWLPFDRRLFQDWEEGRPNFELGYDELTHAWHEILVASDRMSCEGLHRDLLPSEWDRFSKWALWIVNTPGWAATELMTMRRNLLRSRLAAGFFAAMLAVCCAGLAPMFFGDSEKAPETGHAPTPGEAAHPANPPDTGGDPWMLPSWLWMTFGVAAGLLTVTYLLMSRGFRRRRRVVEDVVKHSVSITELKAWFSAPSNEAPWWKIWAPNRRAAIEWLHKRVMATRDAELPSGRPGEASR
ncbi:hypothetical protein GCM10022254_33120 [Actinomadura meridiana]|uniref:Uncharacterized protein n=1 Tax=Actinomadura meridiana TaxID=559626 RepID=A0ABP8C316_9ACTN